MTTAYQYSSSLQRALGSEYRVVARPDHPLLISGPDLLIGGSGRLTAIFIVRRSTVATTLRAKIAATRLALPVTARLIGLGEDYGRPSLFHVMSNLDEIIRNSRAEKALAAYSSSDAQPITNTDTLNEIKLVHGIRFATAWQISILRQRHQLEIRNPNEVIENLRSRHAQEVSRNTRGKPNRVELDHSTVAVLPEAGVSSRFRAFVDTELFARFTLDNGVPYTSGDLSPSVLLASQAPAFKSDSEKPVRAAAFGGWITAQPTTAQDIEDLIARATSITKKRVYERSQR